MSTSDFDTIVQRSGYDHVEKAESFTQDGSIVEVLLVHFPEEQRPWSVIWHYDCDPKEPTQGASGRQDFATRDEADAEYEKGALEYRPEAPKP